MFAAEITITDGDILGFAIGLLLAPFLIMWFCWMIFNDLKEFNELRDRERRQQSDADSESDESDPRDDSSRSSEWPVE